MVSAERGEREESAINCDRWAISHGSVANVRASSFDSLASLATTRAREREKEKLREGPRQPSYTSPALLAFSCLDTCICAVIAISVSQAAGHTTRPASRERRDERRQGSDIRGVIQPTSHSPSKDE